MVDIWRQTNLWGMALLIILFCYRVRGIAGPVLTFTWGYFLINCFFIFQNPNTNFKEIGMALDQTSGQAFSQLLLMPLAVFIIPMRYFKKWKVAFSVFGLINAALLFFKGYGFMNASSFDAGMVAALLPLIGPWLVFPYLVAVVTSGHMATALVVIVAQTGAYALKVKKLRGPLFLLCIIILIAGYFLPGAHGYDSSGRVVAWTRFFNWWVLNANYIFGTGVGTFQWIGPYIDGMKGEIFLQMHNDWLQILFEGGAVGLCLAVASYIYLLIKSWNRILLFCAVVGLGVFALTYHPFRFFPSSLFIVCLIREVSRKIPRRQ
jgi:hypothetical protein